MCNCGIHPARFGKKHDPGRIPVQSMMDSDVTIDSVLSLKKPLHSQEETVATLVQCRMSGKACRFVDDDQIVVFIQNGLAGHLKLPVARCGILKKPRRIYIGFDRRAGALHRTRTPDSGSLYINSSPPKPTQ